MNRIELTLRARRFEPSLLQCQLDLPPLRLAVESPFLDGMYRRLDAQRPQRGKDLRGHSLFHPQGAKRDAALQGAMVDGSPFAVVAGGIAVAAAVGDVQFAHTVPTAQEASKQRLAATRGAPHHVAAHVVLSAITRWLCS